MGGGGGGETASLRRSHTRVQLALLLTVVAVAYVAVPPVARLVDSLAGYDPAYYEPKDRDREHWIRPMVGDAPLLGLVSSHTLVSAVLFVLVAVVWLTLVPTRASRRPPRPR